MYELVWVGLAMNFAFYGNFMDDACRWVLRVGGMIYITNTRTTLPLHGNRYTEVVLVYRERGG